MFQPCGEHTPGGAAHALLQGIFNMTRDSSLMLNSHFPLRSPNVQPCIVNSNAVFCLIFKFDINVSRSGRMFQSVYLCGVKVML